MTETPALAASNLSLGLALGVSVVVARGLAALAPRIGLVDLPGGRKQHVAEAALTGGIAIFAGLAAAVPATDLPGESIGALFIALAVILLTGVVDDRREISPRSKLLGQLIAAIVMTSWAGVQVTQLGDLLGFGPVRLSFWAIPFSVVCAIGLTNALNMMDGIDGAAGGVALLASLALAWAAAAQGLHVQQVVLLLLALAVAGFLAWNLRFHPRKHSVVFLGDSGSMLLGFALCWFSIDLTQGPGRSLPPIACVWLLAVPLLDMVRVMFLRRLRRNPVLSADREHLHHLLLARGCSVAASAWIVIGASALAGALGMGAWILGVPDRVMFYAFVALLAAMLGFSWVREFAVRSENRAKL